MSFPITRYAEDAWDDARRLHRLPNTEAARVAFYCGARYTLDVIVDALPSDPADAALGIAEALHVFASAIGASHE